ncbi:hypothetical protein ASF93_13285 [Microbacterium sp. Leaf347]|nr:hypothetical protein ASF93_13285 [Microbacterium sp. Leaf347]KQS01719.1 hypothetical protein ASG00_09800 [Microbacterium sp. Leaf351]
MRAPEVHPHRKVPTTMTLREFTDFADGPLAFPYKGKVYTAPAIGIDLGIRLSGILNKGEDADRSFEEMWPDLFGQELLDEMRADGVPILFVTRAAATILADFEYGREYATAMWETGADPKAMVEYLKSKGNRATRRSRSTGGASKTPSPASSKATTSRKS